MYSQKRFYLEISAAAVSTAVFVLTVIEPRWFEWLFDDAPDGGDGSLESAVALVASLVATALFVRLARREWRRRPAADPGGAA
jgi:hypothetical protein